MAVSLFQSLNFRILYEQFSDAVDHNLLVEFMHQVAREIMFPTDEYYKMKM